MKPLVFEKSAHVALWGSESWEISAHSSAPSVIAGGEEKGRRLNEIYPNFPLLFKVINARTRLSVQVHPNEETCKVTGGEPKTEMWCALSDGPIYAGLRAGTTAADVEAAVKSGRFEELLVRHEAKFGDGVSRGVSPVVAYASHGLVADDDSKGSFVSRWKVSTKELTMGFSEGASFVR